MQYRKRFTDWQLMVRDDTLEQAKASMKRLRSIAAKTKGKIVKEGRGYSVYIKYQKFVRRKT